MTLSAARKKIKATSILTKIKSYERNDALKKYNTSLDLLNNLIEVDKKLSLLLRDVEKEISILGQSKISVEILEIKYAYFYNLNDSLQRNKVYLLDAHHRAEKLKLEFCLANAKMNLTEGKHKAEIDSYRKEIEKICESA